jgi:hypothetical protein
MSLSIASLCVYCGSAEGHNPVYRAVAQRLGRLLAENNIRLIYGGGGIGLMGALAEAVVAHKGHVTGIIPGFLEAREAGNRRIDDLRVVDSMHARKQLMFELSDAFAVLPGGFGTLDEFFEIITWRQLGQHDKPIVLINEAGYWAPLLRLAEHGRQAGFMPDHRKLFHVVERVEDLLSLLETERAPHHAAAAARI